MLGIGASRWERSGAFGRWTRRSRGGTSVARGHGEDRAGSIDHHLGPSTSWLGDCRMSGKKTSIAHGIGFWRRRVDRPAVVVGMSVSRQLEDAGEAGGRSGTESAAIGGPFTLVNQDGETVTESILLGRCRWFISATPIVPMSVPWPCRPCPTRSTWWGRRSPVKSGPSLFRWTRARYGRRRQGLRRSFLPRHDRIDGDGRTGRGRGPRLSGLLPEVRGNGGRRGKLFGRSFLDHLCDGNRWPLFGTLYPCDAGEDHGGSLDEKT